jgi:hypothetical protein
MGVHIVVLRPTLILYCCQDYCNIQHIVPTSAAQSGIGLRPRKILASESKWHTRREIVRMWRDTKTSM